MLPDNAQQLLEEESTELDDDITEAERITSVFESMPGFFVITHLDIDRCPKRAFSPSHYRRDKTCRCGEEEAADDALRVSAALLKRAKELHAHARAWDQAVGN